MFRKPNGKADGRRTGKKELKKTRLHWADFARNPRAWAPDAGGGASDATSVPA
jgi:hypothetical protein